MRKHIVIKIVALLLVVQNSFGQTASMSQMTPAEYQEFISMLVKAKKKRMAKKRALYYQQYYAYQQQAPVQNYAQVEKPAPTLLQKPAEPDTETADKIKALEEVQSKLLVQIQNDKANKPAYDSIDMQLQSELVALRQQLSEEQFQARQNELEWQRRMREQELAQSNTTTTVTADPPVVITEKDNDTEIRLYAERHRAIQNQLSEIRFQQQSQLRNSESLKSDLTLLQDRLFNLTKQLEKNASTRSGNDNNTEINRLQTELAIQKKMIEDSSKGQTNSQLSAMEDKISLLEKQNAQLLLLTQNNDSSSDSMVIKKVVIDTIRMSEQPDSNLMLLANKIADMEKELATANTTESNSNKAQEELIKTLQNRIVQLEADLNNKPAPAPPIVKVVPAPAPEKTPISTFVTNHRQENVYFDNGSYRLNSSQREKITTIASWLDTYELLDINVKGFASSTGSRAANERISKLRAQSVKEALVKMGVASNRIIIQPLGIDATSIDPANARRAEIHLFVRGQQ